MSHSLVSGAEFVETYRHVKQNYGRHIANVCHMPTYVFIRFEAVEKKSSGFFWEEKKGILHPRVRGTV